MSAKLVGVGELGWHGRWELDPALLDGGLQLALLWTKRVLRGASLPTAVEALHVYGSAPRSGVSRCVLKAREVGSDRAVCDLVFATADGRLIAELRGVETHLLSKVGEGEVKQAGARPPV